MTIFDILTLFGGLAMFLYGMRLMGDGLKESSSGALKKAMESVTNNPVKAFVLGLAVTAIIQSSTATIVITSGLVAAGLLTLHQSLGIIIGANVGTTVTGQIIRLLDLNASGGTSWLQIFKPSSLAPIALIIGIILIMAGRFKSARQVGNIAIGFGILFSGLMNMTSAVTVLTESGAVEKLFTGLGNNPFLGYATGAGVAFVLQSSSATIGILQAFAASGRLTFKAVYPVIVGVYLGDSVTTAIVCSIGAGAEQRRVGIVNTLYNLCKSALVLIVVAILHQVGLLDNLWDKVVNSGMIANTNTIFNLCCAIAIFPTLPILEKLSCRIVKDDVVVENKYQDKLDALNPMFFDTPALALRSVYDALLTQLQAVRQNIEKSFGLLRDFDEKTYQEIMDEEANIDLLTDRISRYVVEFLPNLRGEGNAAILNEYYKVVTEFERLGDHAVNIADNAENLHKNNRSFTDAAFKEIEVLEELLGELLDYTETAFAKRDIEAAFRIEPLQQLVSEMVLRLKRHHLIRMGRGECDIFADSNFENLMSDLKRIADVSTNIGEAVLVRVNPELADDEHNYFTALRAGNDKKFNELYEEANHKYMGRIPTSSDLLKESLQESEGEDFSEVAD
jgi:phosphate:Na+ symporter